MSKRVLPRIVRVLLGAAVAACVAASAALADASRRVDPAKLERADRGVAARNVSVDDSGEGAEQPARARLALDMPTGGEAGATLGMELADSIDPFVAAIGLTGQSGALVVSVARAGPAAAAGILPGDLIVAVAGAPVRDADRLRVMLRDLDAATARLDVIRTGAGPGDLLAQLRAAALGGNRDAILALGDAALINLDGRGQPGAALDYYRQAFGMGDPRAAYRLGTMYANGRGIDPDLAEATRWYRIAAEEGVPAAQFALGLAWWNGQYWTGLALERDYAEAVRLFRLAAGRGYVPSYGYLGAAHAHGLGVEADRAVAADWYDRAAATGDVDAMVRRAEMLEQGEDGDGAGDVEGALALLRQAAHLGSVEANRRLGERYWLGDGVPVHPLDAIAYLKVAADHGDAASMTLIARILLSGYGVTRDAAGAVDWYFRAYQAGDAEAGFALALAYTDGIGVVPDPGRVAGFMLEAIRRGSRDALAEMKGNADSWDAGVREDVQELLRASGLYTGAIDGVFGPGTQRALDVLAGGG